jgi:hypothetical protein
VVLDISDEAVGKSEVFRPIIGRGFRRSSVTVGVRCACAISAASATNDDDNSDFCSIASDMLRFFKMGFFTPPTKELLLDRRLTGAEFCCEANLLQAGCRGPYNHVTSTSLSLCCSLAFDRDTKLGQPCTDGDDRR